MVREVDLVSYLPPFVAEYKQINAALRAEDPEFRIMWESTDRTLRNAFIATADEYGIARFEKMLGVYPSREDTLASRRSRVQSRWLSALPYTERMLLEKLTVLCGDNNFVLTKRYESYRIELDVSLEMYGQIEELERVISDMLPCNMVAVIQNNICIEAKGTALACSGICVAECFFITNDSKETITINGTAMYGGSFINTVDISVVGDFKQAERTEKWQNFQN